MKSILLLEDESSLMNLLRHMLKQYSLIEATTAEQALRLFTEHGRQVDLLLADVTLPTSSGIQVALLLRSEIPDLPVILTSGHPVSVWSERDSADLERLGLRSVAILPKPYQAQGLSNAVRELLAPRSKAAGTAWTEDGPIGPNNWRLPTSVGHANTDKRHCMKKPSAIERTSALVLAPPTGRVTVLCISPLDEDHLSLQAIIGHSKWMLFDASDLASALALLQQHEIAVLLCERDLTQGTWTDVLEHIQALPNTPSLIVTSRLADDRLWAEALNLGAWDVLATPFDRTEVIRSVKSAWQHWHDQIHMRATTVKMTAAS